MGNSEDHSQSIMNDCIVSTRIEMKNTSSRSSSCDDDLVLTNKSLYTQKHQKYQYFRCLLPRDRKIVQKLHEEWFPVKYNDEFYDSLVRLPPSTSQDKSNKSHHNHINSHRHGKRSLNLTRRYRKKEFRNGLYSSVVVEAEMMLSVPNERNRGTEHNLDKKLDMIKGDHGAISILEPLLDNSHQQVVSTSLSLNKNRRTRPIHFQEDVTHIYSDEDNAYDSPDLEKGPKMKLHVNDELNASSSAMPFLQISSINPLSTYSPPFHSNETSLPSHILQNEQIVGCLIGTFLPISKISEETQSLLVYDPDRHPFLFYIMTLGTISDKRNSGYGSKMIQNCIQMLESEENKQCGCIYLHVITYNKGAIRFYETLGFHRITEIQGYYTINDEKHNCYLYAKQINGNKLIRYPGARVLSFVSDTMTSVWKCIYLNIYYYTSYFRAWNRVRN